MNNPQAWRKYIAAVDSGILPLTKELTRFAARYRTAASLESIKFGGISDVTSESYTLVLKIGLTYSALETLEVSIDGRLGQTKVIDGYLAAALRESDKGTFFELLMEELDNGKLITNVRDFRDGKNDNMRFIAQGLRHLTFHGELSPHGSGLSKSKKLRSVLAATNELVLLKINERFSEWVDREVAK